MLLVAAGVLATASIDVVVASQRRAHDRKVAAARAEQRAERALLHDVSVIAVDVQLASDPIVTALRSVSLPAPGELVGARDAIAHGGGGEALAADVTRLRALHPPASMRRDLTKLVTDVVALRDQADRLAGTAEVKDLLALSKRLNDDDAATFPSTAATVSGDLVLLFDRQHLTPPAVDSSKDDTTPANWIFGASAACIDAQLALVPVFSIHHLDSVATTERYARLWQHALSVASARITALPRPVGRRPLPATLTGRLGVLRYNARLFGTQLAALKRSDPAGYQVAVVKVRTLLPSLAQLSKALRSYGAAGCGNVMDGWAGVKSPASKGGIRNA